MGSGHSNGDASSNASNKTMVCYEEVPSLDVDPETESFIFEEGYTILKKIGEGSYGKVYKVEHRESGNILALKLLDRRGRSYNDMSWLKQEVRVASKMLDPAYHHHSLLNPKDVIGNDNVRCIVTDYAPQGDLEHALYYISAFKESMVRDIGKQLLEGLQHLHRRKYVHRDVKPANIMCFEEGKIRLGDFGSAGKHVGTGRGPNPGTIVYMAPELHAKDNTGQPVYNYKVDLFSAGVTLYELVTGEMPFEGSHEDELVAAHHSFPVYYPPTLSKEMQALLEALLQINPQKRLDYSELWLLPIWTAPIESLDRAELSAPREMPVKRESLPGIPTILRQLGVESASTQNSTIRANRATINSPLSRPDVPSPKAVRPLPQADLARLPKVPPAAVRKLPVQKPAVSPLLGTPSSRFRPKGHPSHSPVKIAQPVPKAKWPAPAALRVPAEVAAVPSTPPSAHGTQEITGHRIIASEEMTPRRMSTSKSDSPSRIGLAAFGNLDILETTQAKPQGRIGGRKAALARLGPIALPQLPRQPPQLAASPTSAAKSAVSIVPAATAAATAATASIKSAGGLTESGCGEPCESGKNNASPAASTSGSGLSPTHSSTGSRQSCPSNTSTCTTSSSTANSRTSLQNPTILAIGQALAEVAAQQAAMQQTLMDMQAQMQQQAEILTSIAAQAAQGRAEGKVSRFARACWSSIKRGFAFVASRVFREVV